MGQADGKYWIANNPNAAITDSQAQKLAGLSGTELDKLEVLGDATINAADLNRLATQHKVVTAVTALTAAGALAANTRYHLNDTDTAAYTLPAASASTAGDKIEVIYIAALANSEVHKFGTAGEFFADTSIVIKPSNATGNAAFAIDVADGTGDDFLNLTGATDAGWGIGTALTFIYNGSKWHVECWGTAQGNGSTAATAAFAAT